MLDMPYFMENEKCRLDFKEMFIEKIAPFKDSLKNYNLIITGGIGAGKSTIANLLCRFYDVGEGSVLIDDVDIKDYNLQYLRKNIGITMQEAFLFSDTVEGNICFGNMFLRIFFPQKSLVQETLDTFLWGFLEWFLLNLNIMHTRVRRQ